MTPHKSALSLKCPCSHCSQEMKAIHTLTNIGNLSVPNFMYHCVILQTICDTIHKAPVLWQKSVRQGCHRLTGLESSQISRHKQTTIKQLGLQ